MWYSDGTPKLRHIAPPGIFIISTISSQSCQSLVNTSKESIELFECQRKSTCARRVLSELADGLSVFSLSRQFISDVVGVVMDQFSLLEK